MALDEAPSWTREFFNALNTALSSKNTTADTQAEDELIAAARLIVRIRFGMTEVKDPIGLVHWHIDRALKALKDEEADR